VGIWGILGDEGVVLGSWIYEDGAFKVIVQGAIPHGEPWLGIEMLTNGHGCVIYGCIKVQHISQDYMQMMS
jgi:hypothetical protein